MPFTSAQTTEAMRSFTREVFVGAEQTATVDTNAIETAVTAIVGFIEGNTVAINNALPEPFKSTTSVEQKRHLVGLVAARLGGIV